LKAMEVHFPADKEARLRQFATRTGKDAEQIVEEAVDRLLAYGTRLIEAIEGGRASARRGDLLEHDSRRTRRTAIAFVMRVRWTTNAADDLAQIVMHIRQDNPEAAAVSPKPSLMA
jgi:predicted transcriptional regulator